MRRALSALLAGLLAVSVTAAVAPGDVTAELSPRDGRTAVSIEGDSDTLFLGGRVPAGSKPTATLQALDHADAVLKTWDVTGSLVVTDGAVSGSVPVTCFHVPGCLGTSAGTPERQAALDALGGYRLELRVEDVSDLSGVVDFDPDPPVITAYALTSPTTIEVRFSEDVEDPDGDAPKDWMIDDVRQVYSVQGTGDTRVLTFLTPYEDGATPEVFYLPTPSPDSQRLPNRPYVDRAGNELNASGRRGLAADEIPPPVPSIEAIEGTAVTYEAEDQAVPVLGNDPTPEVRIGDVGEQTIAQLFLDDGDGTFEPDGDDTLVGEATGDGSGSATIESDALPADGVHRFYARSRDDALCDPDDPDSATCPNHSGRSEEGRYDLDTVAPTPVGDALDHGSTIALRFTEPLVGADGAGQWTVSNPAGGPVTVEEVTGSGDSRTLQFSGGPLVPGATLDWTAPASDPYRDEHGNQLTGFPVGIDAAPLPLLEVLPTDVTEGDPPAVPEALDPAPTLDFTLRVSDIPAGEQVEVAYETVLGGQQDADGDDYEHTSGTATITGVDGAPDQTVVAVTVTRDVLHEFDEAVFLQVRNVDDTAPQFTLPGDAASLATAASILDDDEPVVATISPASADVGEGEAVELAVVLDAVSGRPVTIDWATTVADDPTDGEAGIADVPAQSGSVTIPAGEQRAPFEVEVADDGLDEPDETFSVELTAPEDANATLGDPDAADLRILDDDVPVPTLRVTPGSVAEDDYTLPVLTNAELPFTFTLSEGPEQPIEISWTTDDSGTAGQDVDFTGDAGFVRFEVGQTEQQVLVDVTDDDLDEHDETVALRVADPAAAVLVDDAGDPVTELTTTGTITDDDPLPSVAFADGAAATVDEGDSATFTVELGAVSGRDVTVQWATVFDGTADTQDLPHQSDTVVIPEGQTRATFRVATTPDAPGDGERTVTIELSSPEHAELGDPSRTTLTITDDVDGVPTITLSGGDGDEDTGALPPVTTTSPVPFTVELSRTTDQDVTVRYRTTAGGTATAESDFTGGSGTLTIPAGQTTGTVEVEVLADELDEFDEHVELELSDATNAALAGSGATLASLGTILDDDAPAVASLGGDTAVDEGEAVVLEVTLDTRSGKPVTVDWRTADQAADGSDYAQSSGTLEFDPGETSQSITIPTFDDADVEGDEGFRVELTGTEHARVGDGEAVVTITDNDEPLPDQNVLSLSSAATEEGDPIGPFPALVPTGSLDFALTLQAPASEEVEVDYVVTPGTADGTSPAGEGRDVEPTDGTATIPADQRTASIEVGTYADLLDEFDETVLVTITDVRGGDAAMPPAGLERTGRILDDDPPAEVAFASDDVEVTEGAAAEFTVELDTASGKPVTVTWTTSHDGTADTADVPAQSGQVTVAAGRTTASFEVLTTDDDVREPQEHLSVVLSAPHQGRLSEGRPTTARLTVLDDELPVVSLTGDAVEEGDPTAPLPLPAGGNELTFEVRLSEPADGDVTIAYATRAGSATAGDDFQTTDGRVTIADGDRTATVTVPVVPDFADEFDEDLQLVLTDVDGGAVLPGGELAGTGRILDDDPQAQLRVNDATVLAGDVAELDVTLDNASGKGITVAWALVDGTATAGEDYVADSGTLSFPAGTTTRTVQVATLDDDDTDELIEQFELVLSGATNAGIDDARGTISIVDLGVDGLPTATAVFLDDVTAREADGDRTALVPVQLSSARDQDTTVTWTTQELSATEGEDYRAAGGQVTIPAGATTAQIAVTIIGDDEVEPNEDFLVLLTEADGAVITGPTGRVTIADDDADGDGSGDPGDGLGDGGGDGGTDGAPDGSDGANGSDDGNAGGGTRELPATGGGAGLGVIGLAVLAARRRREHG